MEIYSGNLTGNYDTDVAKMDGILRPAENFDMLKRELTLNGRRMVMYYIDGFIKSESMQKLMMYLFTVKDFGDGSDHAAADFASRAVPTVEVDVTDSIDQLVLMVMSGCTAYLCEGFGKNALVIDLRTYPARETEEPENDKVMRGSRDGFVETLMFNLAMIRRRIRDPDLTFRYLNAGTSSRTDIALCYMEGKADPKYVNLLVKKIESLTTDSLIMGHQSIAESIIRQRWYLSLIHI